MSEIALSLKNVSKCFKRYPRPIDRLKDLLLPGKNRADVFWALRDINIEIPRGQTVGIIGRNGSGKSTLLQIVAGTLTPTTGEICVNGRVSALLELGSGFNPEFTGRQNVFFNGRLLGLSEREVENKFDEIAGFADIGDFIDQPVKTYSSGMYVRLAFAVAVSVYPEILIVDEALSVGDVIFQHRCMRRMRALMDSGVTTLFVSHDAGAIKTLCNQAIMIHDGQVYTSGVPNTVVIEYLKLLTEMELELGQETASQSNAQANETVVSPDQPATPPSTEVLTETSSTPTLTTSTRRGSRQALFEKVKLLNHLGEQTGEIPVFGFNEEVTLLINLKAYAPLQSCVVGFYVCDKNGTEIIGSNTFEENLSIGNLRSGDTLEIQFKFRLPLRNGSYSLTVAGTEDYTSVTFDWIDNVIVFQVLPPDTGKRVFALVDQPMVVKVIKQVLPKVVLPASVM